MNGRINSAEASACGAEVLRTWSERVETALNMGGSGKGPVLACYLPVLFDNIAEAIVPGIARPFASEKTCVLSDVLRMDQYKGILHTDDVVKELQIFRSALFSVSKSHSLRLSEEQCERMGSLIDQAIREVILVCEAADRALQEAVIAELSHDMRNPLNIASALAQLIQRRPDNDKIVMMATRIHEKIVETDAVIQATIDLLAKKQNTAA